jgi:transcriptional regulator with XRE-family HTH domain
MKRRCENIYQIARKAAGLTQEQAAEMLYISVRSIAEYEAGRTIPPDDIVCKMIDLYKAYWLGYQHLKQASEVGRRFLPDIQISDLAMAVLRLQKETADVGAIQTAMVEIVCDGKIDGSEQQRWKTVEREISEMAGAAMAVIFSK